MERTILEALGYYLIRLVMFGATAAAGIAVGIKLRKNNPDMRDAIKRWEEDIAFVADYDTDNQTKVGRATFKQGGKITRR